MRTRYGDYKEYHTSLDDFNFVTEKGIYGGFKVAKEAINNLQKKIVPKSVTICEPKLSNRGLHKGISIKSNYNYKGFTKLLLSFLQYSDGTNDLYEISKFLRINKNKTKKLFKILKSNKLVE